MSPRVKDKAADGSSLSPFEACARIVGRQQKGRILSHLLNGETSFDELSRGMPELSPQSLQTQLRELEVDGVVVGPTTSLQDPFAVEYRLTDLGQSLRPLIRMMANWTLEYVKTRAAAEGFPDKSARSW